MIVTFVLDMLLISCVYVTSVVASPLMFSKKNLLLKIFRKEYAEPSSALLTDLHIEQLAPLLAKDRLTLADVMKVDKDKNDAEDEARASFSHLFILLRSAACHFHFLYFGMRKGKNSTNI